MAKPKQLGSGPDLASLGGVALAVGGIVAGLILEGGKIQDISQFTAGLIVMVPPSVVMVQGPGVLGSGDGKDVPVERSRLISWPSGMSIVILLSSTMSRRGTTR